MRVIGSYRPEFGVTFNALARELGVADRVSMDGWLRQDDLIARVSAVGRDCRCTSRCRRDLEYLGSASNKLFEYAAMGLPVVVPNRESYRDFLNDAEWVTYADVEQPESIARAIASIFADRERYAAMSRAARRAFEEQYNYERVFAPALERIVELGGIAKPSGRGARSRRGVMKICIGSAGPFHAFDLARQMERLGHLEHLYTAYPSWRVDGMPKEKVSTFPWLMAPAMLANRFGFNRVRDSLNVPMIETFDRWMAERLAPCDVFHCLSSFGLQSHRAARSRHGALTVCDRGSAHIEYQDEILRDEFARFGAPYPGIDSRLVERELEEYAFCDLIFVPSSFAMRTFVDKGVPREKTAAQSVRRRSRDVSSRTEKRSHISRIVRRHSLAAKGSALSVRGDGDAWTSRR